MRNSNTETRQLTKAERPKRAIIFTRARSLPRDTAQEFAQLAAQERYCHQVAKSLKAEAVKVYVVHGGTTDPGTRRIVEGLLREIERGGVDYVIAQSLDRLARRPCDVARIVEKLTAAEARFVTTADPAEAFLQDVSLFFLVAKVRERRAA